MLGCDDDEPQDPVEFGRKARRTVSTYTTLTTAKTAYLENADYADGLGDLTKAYDFRSAVRALILLLPQQATVGGNSTTMSIASLRQELERVDRWIREKKQTGAKVTYGDVRYFRD